MKVYVIEIGEYELRCIAGVYATLELAQQAHPHTDADDISEWAVEGADNGGESI